MVCLNSATAALEMVQHLLDIQSEDEVIVPAYTYTATASVLAHWIYLVGVGVFLVGAYVVFMKKYYHSHEEYLKGLKVNG